MYRDIFVDIAERFEFSKKNQNNEKRWKYLPTTYLCKSHKAYINVSFDLFEVIRQHTKSEHP